MHPEQHGWLRSGWKSEFSRTQEAGIPQVRFLPTPRSFKISAMDYRRPPSGQPSGNVLSGRSGVETRRTAITNRFPLTRRPVTSDLRGVFVETKNLDGETISSEEICLCHLNVVSEEDLERLSSSWIANLPPDLYTHQSILRYTDPNGRKKTRIRDDQRLLLVAVLCGIRNGLSACRYTGADPRSCSTAVPPLQTVQDRKETNFTSSSLRDPHVDVLDHAIVMASGRASQGLAPMFRSRRRASGSIAVDALITLCTFHLDFTEDVIQTTVFQASVIGQTRANLLYIIEVVKTSRLLHRSDIECTTTPQRRLRTKTWNISDDLGQSNTFSRTKPVLSPRTSWSSRNVQLTVSHTARYHGGSAWLSKDMARVIFFPREQARSLEVMKHSMLDTLDRTFKNDRTPTSHSRSPNWRVWRTEVHPR